MKTYKGYDIFPALLNSSGIRWYARTTSGQILRADTLPNIKWMIRDYEMAKNLGLEK